ncbi:P-type conjugative transfer protein TrbL [Metapseudomonas furukawaii]|uniref:IncP-type conjugative transfer protein n=1 Tax=Metapseudomonas furukawaii TaxID=1149133 RepID=A0AAD1FI64_METFU|nr:P-type conjugative transfer protein TrbL [Pseudomonas furukawaii]ELS26301.1 Conjugative transfer protein TrbL [Pseudomonas furukawaii]BAU77411.1 IncP-type conjugative transfer protein [Pseudomonas furukawaii]
MNHTLRRCSLIYALLGVVLLAMPEAVFAAVPQENILDGIIARFKDSSATWESRISGYATNLFWALNAISLAWGLGQQALRSADIPDVFSEVFRHIMFTGFHYWLLINGSSFSTYIINSLRQAAGAATGASSALGPSDVIDIGLNIAAKALDNFSALSPIDSLGFIFCCIVILICLALIAANMMIMLCAGWVLSYAGILFLGFGGSRWTSDMAINYYRTILSIGASLFTMTLLIGIGQSFMNDMANSMSADAPLMEMFVCLICAVVLLLLVDKLPQMVAGIVTGSMGGGFQGFGAGTGIAAAGLAVGAIGGMAAAAGAAATSAAGGVSAVKEAAALADMQMAQADGGLDTSSFDGGGSAGGSGQGGEGGGGGAASSGGQAGSSPSRASAGWISSFGSNLAKASSAQAMESLGGRVDAAIKNTFGGKVAERLAEQRAELAGGDDQVSEKSSGEEAGGDFGNSIGGSPAGDAAPTSAGGGGMIPEAFEESAFGESDTHGERNKSPDVSDLPPEMQSFVQGKNA